MVFEIFCPIAILACVSSNSFGYVQEQAVDLIIDCMAKWKFYARTLCISFITSDKIKATCFLWYFDFCSILACVFSQQFWLHARSGNTPYFCLCGKMNVLPSRFKYFFVITAQIKDSYMFFEKFCFIAILAMLLVIFWLMQHFGFRVFSTISTTC